MRLFYDPEIKIGVHELRQEEAHHCAKVLRLSVGSVISVTDGRGFLFRCQIIEVGQKKTILQVLEPEEGLGKRNYSLHVALCPTKSIDRTEWFIEKSTEIGIDEITPLISQNSERKLVKYERLNRVAEAAMKQSHKSYHPKINEQISFDKFINQKFDYYHKFIAHCEDDLNKKYLGHLLEKNKSVIVLIGPEGDFTPDEIKTAKQTGFIPVSLGNSRLRTETAGIVACDICSVINQFE